MRYSQLLIPTVKEVPAEAEIPSHQLMIRAGFIRKLASGTYSYLPIGWRSLRKIMQIIRDEMDQAGAQELALPILQPIELWQQTGRDVDYGETLPRFTDRHGRKNVLAPTAEEVITALVAAEVNSYKQLPMNLYQINLKIRDEFRPRFGVLRSREFMMKDAYSFHANTEDLDREYHAMYDAYKRIFQRCGVEFVIVEAESGEMGGSGSHQFTVPCENGEDVIVYTENGEYAANIEKAAIDAPKPDPALQQRRSDAPEMQEEHTPDVGTIEAVCKFMGTRPEEMIKTLIYQAGDETVAVLMRGDHELNPEKFTQITGGKHVEPAEASVVREMTGAEVGYAGPVGILDKVSHLYVDHSVAAMSEGATGANKTDHHIRHVVPTRDFPLEGDTVTIADLRNAVEGDTHDGKPLKFRRGIEVGQVFKLGTKYSAKLDATFLDENGKTQPTLMGCYGIGVNRVLASAIEAAGGHDKNGMILPISIAPFEAEVIMLKPDSDPVREHGLRIYNELRAAGVDVLLDDRKARPGVKFKDADLIGIPLRIVVGDRGLKEGNVEIKRRTDEKPEMIKLEDAVQTLLSMREEMLCAQSG